jgi:hypothetical protein
MLINSLSHHPLCEYVQSSLVVNEVDLLRYLGSQSRKKNVKSTLLAEHRCICDYVKFI